MDRHTLALISIIGSSLDVTGALYLAYLLLGGEHGPLRILTRAVTYGVLFGTGDGQRAHPLCRMGGRSRARKTHGRFGRWPDSDRLHTSIRSVLGDAARREHSVVRSI